MMLQALSRRSFIRQTLSAIPIAAVVPIGSCAAIAGMPATDVGRLFARWRDFDLRYTEEEHNPSKHAEYQRLQALVVDADPVTARDIAMQLYAETDGGASDFRDVFFKRMTGLALDGRI